MLKETEDKIVRYYQDSYSGVSPNLELFISDMLKEKQAKDEVAWVRRFHRFHKRDQILDYGCGIGNVVIHLGLLGYNVDGYEVDNNLIEIVRDRIKQNHLPSHVYSPGVAPKKKYDLLTSIYVAEHVNNLYEYIKNGIYHLKPGGEMLLFTCNYSIQWEFHYQLFLPIFSKFLSKVVLKLLGRNTTFIDDLLFVKPSSFNEVFYRLKKEGLGFSHVNIGETAFLESISQSKYHSPLFIRFFKIAQKLKVVKILINMGLYNPIIIIIKRNT